MILRQQNWLGGQRIDVPHLRALESSAAADFDLLAGTIMAGSKPLVVTGFQIVTTGAIGNPATSLQLAVANSVIMHPMASEHGTIFQVAADAPTETLNATNAKVQGGFTAGSVNYVGLDLLRTADDSTADLVMFLDSNALVETPKSVPLARILGYKIVIGTVDFSVNSYLLPIAKVTTDASNVVTLVEDARQMIFRLGSGGSTPNRLHAYPWSTGRAENTTGAVFTGADKDIPSFKDWMDAVMTRLWELGGGEHWYSATADRNVTLTRSGTQFTNGQYFEWDGANLHWRGLKFLFPNSTGSSNAVTDQLTSSPGLTDLADGDCIYVDLDRTQNATVVAAKSALLSLGSPTVPGSRQVIAYRMGANVYTRGDIYAVGAAAYAATNPVYLIEGTNASIPNAKNVQSITAQIYYKAANDTVHPLATRRSSVSGADPFEVQTETGTVLCSFGADGRLKGLTDPTAAQDGVTKNYADTHFAPLLLVWSISGVTNITNAYSGVPPGNASGSSDLFLGGSGWYVYIPFTGKIRAFYYRAATATVGSGTWHVKVLVNNTTSGTGLDDVAFITSGSPVTGNLTGLSIPVTAGQFIELSVKPDNVTNSLSLFTATLELTAG